MSMILNEDQKLLRDSARDFLFNQSPVSLQRKLRNDDVAIGYSTELWAQAAELGWPAAVYPEEEGGLAVGYAGMGSIFETMGRSLAALPLLSSVVLCGELLLQAGTPAQREQWLPAIMAGEKRLALALDESQLHTPASFNTTARREGEQWVLQGEKWFVIDGVQADAFIVAAQPEGQAGIELFLVASDAAGLDVLRTRLVDSRNHARVVLNGVRVSDANRLQGSDNVAAALDHVLDRARACLAAEGLGLLREVFERTVSYLKERVQFDVPIGSFQALQHRAARLYTELELLESCVRAALEAIDLNRRELPQLVSIAKARASDLCEKVLNESVQMHGGIGVTDEFDLGLFYKRARVLQHTLGDGIFHRNRYAQLLGF